MSARQKLFNRITQNLPQGRLEWIGLRPQKRAELISVDSTEAIAGSGLEGDRRCYGTPGSSRQVTLISLEHIKVVEKLLSKSVPPALLRRNLVISGVNIFALRHQQFSIGGAVFEATAACHPCSRMEEALGRGGHAAMLGHGGLCAKILQSGKVSTGDAVIKLDSA